MLSRHEDYPDDEETKDVYLQAHGLAEYPGFGDRHVLIHWRNRRAGSAADTDHDDNGVVLLQVIQLTGQAGNYSYYAPVVLAFSQSEVTSHTQYHLGQYTRAQRDEILKIAETIKYERRSVVNGCRVWTRDLLMEMVARGLLREDKFEEVDTGVPLVKRRNELPALEKQ